MDDPFLGNCWYQPSRRRHSPTVKVPVYPVQRRASPKPTAAPKVMSIPVHFVGSESTRSSSVLKIQKVFRGFLVRKSMNKIASIKSKIDEIERRISRSETLDLIRRDEKERLRVIETLMALLFKLDGIRGIDSGVRICRREVTKKAVALQEKVDSVFATSAPAGGQTLGSETKEEEALEDAVGVSSGENLQHEGSVSANCNVEIDNVANQTQGKDHEIEFHLDANCRDNVLDESFEESERPVMEATDDGTESLAANCEDKEIPEGSMDTMVQTEEEACVVKEVVENCNTTPSVRDFGEESVDTNPVENSSEQSVTPTNLIEEVEENNSAETGNGMEVQKGEQRDGNVMECLINAGEKDYNKRSGEFLQKMMEDNEKMMTLMMQLFERNEMQTRMLSLLSSRVEQLEKAFLCGRLLRKKKKRHSA